MTEAPSTMQPLLLTLVNLLLCAAVGWSAMCRLSMMTTGVRLRVAGLYLFLFVASVFSGLQFWIFGTFAGWPDVMTSGGVLALMLAGLGEWHKGPPARALCKP